ncbi:unnamed protein product, partial [Ectocarpus sp. 12 AP-2014]
MAREFFQGANKEGVAVLKQMLEMEAWQRVPVPLKADEGGVGGLIDTNAQRFCSPHRVYRGIRKPYLHLMHDVMALEEEQESSPEQSPEGSSSCSATKPTLDPSSTPPTTPPPPSPPPPPDQQQQQQQPLLRAWHQRGNPFQMSGDNYLPLPSVQEGPTEAGTAAGVAAAGGETPMGMSLIAGGGVGLGMLADGADVDDDPDAVLAVCGAPGG